MQWFPCFMHHNDKCEQGSDNHSQKYYLDDHFAHSFWFDGGGYKCVGFSIYPFSMFMTFSFVLGLIVTRATPNVMPKFGFEEMMKAIQKLLHFLIKKQLKH